MSLQFTHSRTLGFGKMTNNNLLWGLRSRCPGHGSYFPFSACCHIVCFYRRDLFPMQGSLKGHLAPTPERPPGRPRVYSLAISNILPRFSSPTYRPLVSSCFLSRNLPSSRVFQHISRMPAQRNKNSKRSKRSAGERVN